MRSLQEVETCRYPSLIMHGFHNHWDVDDQVRRQGFEGFVSAAAPSTPGLSHRPKCVRIDHSSAIRRISGYCECSLHPIRGRESGYPIIRDGAKEKLLSEQNLGEPSKSGG